MSAVSQSVSQAVAVTSRAKASSIYYSQFAPTARQIKSNHMPTPRKSCIRCYADKARCSYSSRSQSCARCRQKNVACELPDSHRLSANESITSSVAAPGQTDESGLQSSALSQRIDKVEGLLAELKSALATSAHKTNDEGRQIEAPIEAIPSNNAPRVDHSSASAPSSESLPNSCFLPPLSVGQALLTTFLRDFNSKIPLLAPEAIVSHMRDCYSGAAKGVASSWILTYLVFGIAHQLRTLDPSSKSDHASKAEHYLDKCLDNFSRVLLEEPSVEIVQCLLGVAIMLQGSARSHRVASFVSIAMHMAQELGYDEAYSPRSKDPTQNKVESYVFWVAFFMDADLSMCGLKPNTQRHTGIITALPSAYNHDWWSTHEESNSNGASTNLGPNFFHLHCSLAIIQAQALEELFSARANLQPMQQSSSIHTVVTKLADWRRDSKLPVQEGVHGFDLVRLAVLEASYFRTLYQLVAAQQLRVFTYRHDLFSHAALRAQRYHQPSAVYDDARRLLSLLASLPVEIMCLSRTINRAWLAALFTVISALTQLSGEDHQDIAQLAEVVSHEPALHALEIAAGRLEDAELTLSVHYCRELFDVAAMRWYSAQNGGGSHSF